MRYHHRATGRTPTLLNAVDIAPTTQVNLAHNNRYRAERKRLIERVRQWVAETDAAFELPEN